MSHDYHCISQPQYESSEHAGELLNGQFNRQLDEQLNKPHDPKHSNKKTPKTGTNIVTVAMVTTNKVTAINSHHDVISSCMQSQQYLSHESLLIRLIIHICIL